PDRAFDFRYGEDYQTTYDNFGWRVQLRTNTTNSSNPDKNVTYNALSENNGSISEENLTFISRFDKSLGDDYIRVIFDLTNNGNESKLFDIGVYADIQIGGDDRAAVLPLSDGKGFSMENKNDQDPRKGDILTLLVRDGYDVTNVDTLYWGQYHDDRSEIGRNVSNPDESLENTDSVFEISWIGRVIKPGEKQSFNVLLIVGNKIKLPPIIHVNSFNKAQINETTFTVEGTFASVYDDSKIDLYYKYGDDGTEHKLDSLNASNGEKTKHFSIPLQCGPSKTKTLYIWALDEGRRRSNYEATIISTVKPSITIDHPPANGYTVGSDIKIKVKLSDDTSARIVYELDGKVVQGELIEINNEEKTKEIVINTANLSLSEHSLKVYVEDEYGYRSEL
ncbi:Listeria-Bacteroides repeat domain (List Bact rpt) family, partial [Trichomonas vaginalis G3]|uniref:Listeria-Bacteroides repeat domain (List Bact rpt) family n=1 Tax=Trichomonas vaginalis (strain ATCC PRA-98 / G3) TaxID=412133 RepID=UPI0021E53AB5